MWRGSRKSEGIEEDSQRKGKDITIAKEEGGRKKRNTLIEFYWASYIYTTSFMY